MEIVRSAAAEYGFHFVRRTGICDLNLLPIDITVLQRILEHHQRLPPVVSEQCLSLEVFPAEFWFCLPAALTQFFLHIMQAKGKKLKEGIGDLLRLLAPNFERQCAERIADTVLKHPLVCRGDGKLSETIHREELVKMLLELSIATGANALNEADQKALKATLEANGIKDPAGILENARSQLLILEMSHPELSNAMRNDRALLQEAATSFLAKIHSWFDQTIDPTVDRRAYQQTALQRILRS